MLRIFSYVYFLSTFIAAAYFANLMTTSLLSSMIFIGIVFQIIFSFLFISTNKRANHSFWEILLLIIFPPLAFFIFRFEIQKEFWIFVGLFNFFVITGGGIVGLFFSPLIAKIKGRSSRDISKGMNRGARYLKKANLVDYAAFMFGWLAFGFLIILVRTLEIVKTVSTAEIIVFSALFLLCLALVIVRTFQNTIFSSDTK